MTCRWAVATIVEEGGGHVGSPARGREEREGREETGERERMRRGQNMERRDKARRREIYRRGMSMGKMQV